MAWPLASDYSEAVQNPETAFADPTLKHGVVEVDRFGLPRPRTGNFACVFKVGSEGRHWAVRCFLREVTDQQERYGAIGQHIQRARLPYLVGFGFQQRGIRVGPEWFPALKMEWVHGEPLVGYIERHLNEPPILRSLAVRWVALLKALRSAGIAHGDLQHGNILVCGDELRLVDYDGMYVPQLDGRHSAERGHPNYQHPNRRGEAFGPYLDHFSAWVIYASILALSVEPHLWHRLRAGDEALLFREADFKNPGSSLAFQLLENCRDKTLQESIVRIRHMLLLDLAALPPLDVVVPAKTRPSTPWWDDHVRPPAPVRLSPPPPHERVTVAAISLAGALVSGVIVFLYASPAAAVPSALVATALILLATCVLRFTRLAELSAKTETLARLKTATAALRTIDTSLGSLRKEEEGLEGGERSQLAALNDKTRDIARREQASLAEVDRELSVLLATIAARQASLHQQQVEQVSNALKQLQEDYLANALAGYHIVDATLPGIGDALKRRLLAHGIRTAADIEGVTVTTTGWGSHSHAVAHIRVRGRGATHVPGVGLSKAQALRSWRETLAARCRGGMPSSLPRETEARIERRFEEEERRLQGEETKSRHAARERKDRIRSVYTEEHATVAREIQRAAETRGKQRAALDQKVSSAEARKLEIQSARATLERRLESYKYVTFAKFLRTYLGI